ncbi:MAG: class I SAM-dependent methyltransferase [bacterium]|nr:class I SAM-dependent methyltransferase [bacterium]
MSENTDKAVPCYRDYVIKNGKFIGKFEEMYRDVSDPWGCAEKARSLSNKLLLSLLEEHPEQSRILDVGCGLGALTHLIEKTVSAEEVFACDVSPTAIEKAREAVPDVRFFVHDFSKNPTLEFSDGTFSLIVMAEVVWYILPILGRVCDEFHRLLAPEGRLVIKQSFLPPGQQQYGREIVSTPADLCEFAKEAGLSVDQEILLSLAGGDQIYIFSGKAPDQKA